VVRFNGYRRKDAYYDLFRGQMYRGFVHWNVGLGHMASFRRVISETFAAAYGRIDYVGVFKHVIKVDLKATPTIDEVVGSGIMSIKYLLAATVAKELGLLDHYCDMGNK
jgi:hypothetical protein